MKKDNIIRDIARNKSLNPKEIILAIKQEKAQAYLSELGNNLPIDIELDSIRTVRVIQFALSSNFVINLDIEFYKEGILQEYWDKYPTSFIDLFGTEQVFRNHWTISNPPLLVPNPSGNIKLPRHDDFGDIKYDKYEENVLKSFKEICLYHSMFD